MSAKVGLEVIQFWRFIETGTLADLVEQCDESPLILPHLGD